MGRRCSASHNATHAGASWMPNKLPLVPVIPTGRTRIACTRRISQLSRLHFPPSIIPPPTTTTTTTSRLLKSRPSRKKKQNVRDLLPIGVHGGSQEVFLSLWARLDLLSIFLLLWIGGNRRTRTAGILWMVHRAIFTSTLLMVRTRVWSRTFRFRASAPPFR